MSSDVTLGPLTAADSATMFEWINDREQVLFNAPFKPVHESGHQAWYEAIQTRDDLFIFAIRRRALVGSCQLLNVDPVHRNAELRIRIGDVAARGRGVGSAALRLLLRFAFSDLNLHRIHLQVFATNTVAQSAYERVGFRREGVLREAAHIDGRYTDIAVMGMLRSEFEAGGAKNG